MAKVLEASEGARTASNLTPGTMSATSSSQSSQFHGQLGWEACLECVKKGVDRRTGRSWLHSPCTLPTPASGIDFFFIINKNLPCASFLSIVTLPPTLGTLHPYTLPLLRCGVEIGQAHQGVAWLPSRPSREHPLDAKCFLSNLYTSCMHV